MMFVLDLSETGSGCRFCFGDSVGKLWLQLFRLLRLACTSMQIIMILLSSDFVDVGAQVCGFIWGF